METIGKNLEMLRAFHSVAIHQSYTLAAEKIGVSKAMLSKQVKLLEHNLRAKLFHRTTRRISLTEQGLALLSYSQKIFDLSAEADKRIQDMRQGQSGVIRISAPPSFGEVFFNSFLRTVANYAVIDWGFDVVTSDNERMPAGAVLRQGHVRAAVEDHKKIGGYFLENPLSKKIEILLRSYGITSSGEDLWGPDKDQINIQGSVNKEVVDFGSYLSREEFKNVTRSYYNVNEVLDPSKPDFVQPQPDLRVPFSIWGYTETGRALPPYDNPWVWSHRLAQDLRDGKASLQDVKNHFLNFMTRASHLRKETAGRFRGLSKLQCNDVFSGK